MSGRTVPSLAVWLLPLAAVGCGSEQFIIQTRIFPDGSVERAVYQPLDRVPEAARKPDQWQKVTYISDKHPWPESGKISDLPVLPAHKDRGYFAAWGKFPSPQAIPEHYQFLAKNQDVPPGRLVRAYVREDLVSVVEHRWRETLTDIVTLEGMRQAREELANLFLDIGQGTFNEALGKEYDATELFRWLRKDGKAWLADVTDKAFVYLATHKDPDATQGLLEELAAITARYGLNLKPQGKWLEDPVLEKLLEEFALRQVSSRVRRRADGKPVDWETVIVWFHDLKQGGDKGFFPQAVKRVIVQIGGEEAVEKRVGQLLPRIVGHYRGILLPKRTFQGNLMVPGEVVETNGLLVSPNRVCWEFDPQNAWPLGYEMTCRSLEAQRQTQQDLLGRQPLADRDSILRFRELMKTTPKLAEVLRTCRKEKSLAALHALQKKKEIHAAGLLKLLKLPAEPSAGGR
jgi:hypothetical protein